MTAAAGAGLAVERLGEHTDAESDGRGILPRVDVLPALKDGDSSLGRLALLVASCFNALRRDGPGLT
ncbi:hypothetical protein ACFVGY_19045, partial [Streptomyces sp. NPDC127106]|uniref:hypothetical protein n=1 Tax=Streptomyces sp. NPDC127106 TaxID=3345360 RepID=UPI0036303666